jgi:putative phosphoribosyl transferase
MSDQGMAREQEVAVPAGQIVMPGILGLPRAPQVAVLFAHGSGSGRLSPRNNAVARDLQSAGMATLLVDLLTESEAQDRRFVFDIDLLARRLMVCTDWLAWNTATARLPVGYFGASTGAGAALVAAARRGSTVRAVVSRGGRPDLADEYLAQVHSATLLIVGGDDTQVLALNQQALGRLSTTKKLVIVPGASHLFEEPGTLERVAELARDWFEQYLLHGDRSAEPEGEAVEHPPTDQQRTT